jgi:hypothetical protein
MGVGWARQKKEKTQHIMWGGVIFSGTKDPRLQRPSSYICHSTSNASERKIFNSIPVSRRQLEFLFCIRKYLLPVIRVAVRVENRLRASSLCN